ncbi:3407_t:CDS:2, partial [Dentiscutata heterogama]
FLILLFQYTMPRDMSLLTTPVTNNFSLGCCTCLTNTSINLSFLSEITRASCV